MASCCSLSSSRCAFCNPSSAELPDPSEMTVWLSVSYSGSLRSGRPSAWLCADTFQSVLFLRESRRASDMVLPAATTFSEVSIFLSSQLSVFQSSSLDQEHQRPCAWTAAGSLVNVQHQRWCHSCFFFFPILKITFRVLILCQALG